MQTILKTFLGWVVVRGPAVNLNWRSIDLHRARNHRADFWSGLTMEEIGQLNGGN